MFPELLDPFIIEDVRKTQWGAKFRVLILEWCKLFLESELIEGSQAGRESQLSANERP